MKEIITSLDVGSSRLKLVVGEMHNDKLYVLACAEAKSSGIKNGLIVNPDLAVSSFKEVFSKCEDILGVKIKRVVCTVLSYYAELTVKEGKTTIEREDKIVNGDDILSCYQSAVYNIVSKNKEFVNIFPIEFFLDGKSVGSDPKGKKGEKLSCNCAISIVPKKNIYQILSILDSLDVEVDDISFNVVADYYEFKNKEFDNTNVAVVNIGSDLTEVGVFNKGILVGTENLPLGGRSITKDIAVTYGISRKDAVRLKEKFGLANQSAASINETEDVLTKSNENIKINQYEISGIIYSRTKEILELAKKQINLLTNKEIKHIVITGGVTEASGFDLTFMEVFGKDREVSKIYELGVRNNKYSSVVGLIKYYHNKLNFRNMIAYTMTEEEQNKMFLAKKKINNSNLLGKVYSYFFDN
jgi:cell division protein FtsA